jgi:hypothetical protein
VLRRELGAHDAVGGALVLVPLVQLRLDAELVEGAAEERRLGRHPHQRELARRLQPELGAPGREHVIGRTVAALAERLGPGHHRLAGEREGPQAGPQLLHGRPRQRRAADLDDDAAHRTVVARFVQGPQHRAQPRPVPAAQLADQVVGLGLDRHRGEVELEQQGGTAQRDHSLTVVRTGRRPGAAASR